MKKTRFSGNLLLLASSVIISSCGGVSTSEKEFNTKIKPESTAISGDLSGYLEVVDNAYEVTHQIEYNLSIRIKAIKPIGKDLKNKNVSLNLSILAENGTPISGIDKFTDDYAQDQILSLLTKGGGEEIIKFTALPSGFTEIDATTLKKFVVSSIIKDKEKESPSTSISANSTSGTENASSGNYDEMLDAYEKNTDDYIKLINSMNNDNVGGAMNDYLSTLQSAQELEQKLAGAKGTMSSTQVSRMLKIQMKLANAMEKANKKMSKSN